VLLKVLALLIEVAQDEGRPLRDVNFLLSEIIPEVVERYAITDDPNCGASLGGSSGGNCAFTAAWFRPDCGCCDRADPASWSATSKAR
jgi:predicted alpha/beta superfamily hydrolase